MEDDDRAVIPEIVIQGQRHIRHKSLGKRLKKARLAASIKPTVLSVNAALARATVLLIEQGRVPGVDVVERLAQVLNVSPGWLAFDIWSQVQDGECTPPGADKAPPPGPIIEEGAPLLCAGLGDRLRGLREERDLSRKALARLVGLTDTPIRMTEEGRTLPSVATLEQLAKGLGVSPAWLAYGEGPQVLPKVPRQRKVRTSLPSPERRRRGPAKGATGRAKRSATTPRLHRSGLAASKSTKPAK